ncbi:MAG: hypothetical protein WCF85_04030, partial [Rhodospirillaceae bacterium]
ANLANVQKEQGRRAEAIAAFEQALALRPDFPSARFGLCMAQLPVLFRDQAEIARSRADYTRQLRSLKDYALSHAGPGRIADAVGSHQPFFLAYQGLNDRELQTLYGRMIVDIMTRRYPESPALSPPPAEGERIRVGFVCGYVHSHSVWKIPLKGWVTKLDRTKFEVFCYHTRGRYDNETEIARNSADRYLQGPLTLDHWRREILSDRLHVLIYPEIGMDPVTVQLAAQRLAPVQCNSLGHPVTTGMPTIDYYLSSDLMEPADGAEHYTETLVRLPNLSFYYDPLPRPDITLTRADLGLPENALIYWCCQSLYKYLPQYDFIFPRIAKAVPGCRFVFIGYQGGEVVAAQFLRRIGVAFAAEGLRAEDYCIMLPRLDGEHFIAAGAVCDVFLDSIGWSGVNSTLEAIVTDLPMVTFSGPLMRGRHTTAVLRMMGVTETITETIEDYIAMAARLGTDPAFRAGLRARIAANKEKLYRDDDTIKGLEAFLIEAARSPATPF